MTGSNPDGNQTSNGAEITASTDDTLSKNELFHLLQNERRRRVLQYLAETDRPVELRKISKHIAAWECDTTPQQLTSTQYQRVYIALYQSHLPTLADAGLIIYNQSRGTVEQTPLADQAAQYLDRDDTGDRSADTDPKWVTYYTGATAFSILLTGVVWVGFEPIPLISNVGLALLITLLYSGITIAMAVDNGRITLPEALMTWSSDVN